MGQVADRGDHDLDESGLILPAAVSIRADEAVAGVVDQSVYGPTLRGDVGDERGRRRRFRQIGGNDDDLDPVGQAHFVCEGAEAILTSRRDRKVVSMTGIDMSECGADACGSAGDQRQTCAHRRQTVSLEVMTADPSGDAAAWKVEGDLASRRVAC